MVTLMLSSLAALMPQGFVAVFAVLLFVYALDFLEDGDE